MLFCGICVLTIHHRCIFLLCLELLPCMSCQDVWSPSLHIPHIPQVLWSHSPVLCDTCYCSLPLSHIWSHYVGPLLCFLTHLSLLFSLTSHSFLTHCSLFFSLSDHSLCISHHVLTVAASIQRRASRSSQSKWREFQFTSTCSDSESSSNPKPKPRSKASTVLIHRSTHTSSQSAC